MSIPNKACSTWPMVVPVKHNVLLPFHCYLLLLLLLVLCLLSFSDMSKPPLQNPSFPSQLSSVFFFYLIPFSHGRFSFLFSQSDYIPGGSVVFLHPRMSRDRSLLCNRCDWASALNFRWQMAGTTGHSRQLYIVSYAETTSHRRTRPKICKCL